nr:hypothetical protein CFP56_56913 [Quercus suber]
MRSSKILAQERSDPLHSMIRKIHPHRNATSCCASGNEQIPTEARDRARSSARSSAFWQLHIHPNYSGDQTSRLLGDPVHRLVDSRLQVEGSVRDLKYRRSIIRSLYFYSTTRTLYIRCPELDAPQSHVGSSSHDQPERQARLFTHSAIAQQVPTTPFAWLHIRNPQSRNSKPHIQMQRSDKPTSHPWTRAGAFSRMLPLLSYRAKFSLTREGNGFQPGRRCGGRKPARRQRVQALCLFIGALHLAPHADAARPEIVRLGALVPQPAARLNSPEAYKC